MSTEESAARPKPLYARVLRLRRLRIGGFASFLFLECTIAVGVLLALAELVSWWAVPVLPLLVACVVKINDLVSGPRGGAEEVDDLLRDPDPSVERFLADEEAGSGRYDRASAAHGREDRYQAELGAVETVRRGVMTHAPGWDGVPPVRAVDGDAPRGNLRGQVLSGHSMAPHADPYAEIEPGWAAEPTAPHQTHDGRSSTGQPHGASEGTTPHGVNQPAGAAQRQVPTRAHVIGAAVRRSMAVQSQYGRTPATQGSGRHARLDNRTTGRRSGTNERGFGRSPA